MEVACSETTIPYCDIKKDLLFQELPTGKMVIRPVHSQWN